MSSWAQNKVHMDLFFTKSLFLMNFSKNNKFKNTGDTLMTKGYRPHFRRSSTRLVDLNYLKKKEQNMKN